MEGTAMKAIMMILAVIASASNSTAAFHGRSSFLQTAKDRYLVGHVTNCRMASSISSCAQFCLKMWPLCRSINYREGKGRTICELNDKGLESADTESSAFVSMPGFIFGQLLNFQRHKSCNEIQKKNPGTKSALYEIHPLLNANPIEVFCELDIEEGGFTFLPRSLTLRPDAQQIVDALFKEKKTVLLSRR
ncbi:hypothetical protein AWC38_SpisGene21905 [Stylophora pistillata]|uniref:Apple domain-containing protein n=1 Tax=Stylophora pistillata TaxID=50429 RepID=A0A2B4RC85_STYPI|nr:hypothetical protein AWC38_SpisGene21905 [Stylophora pistillata]